MRRIWSRTRRRALRAASLPLLLPSFASLEPFASSESTESLRSLPAPRAMRTTDVCAANVCTADAYTANVSTADATAAAGSDVASSTAVGTATEANSITETNTATESNPASPGASPARILDADAAFDFGLIGDTGYTRLEVSTLDRVLAAMDAQDLAFVVHVGDIKSGSSACTDALLADRIAQLDRSRHPLLFTPGDNDWTDCHRAAHLRDEAATLLAHDRLNLLRSLAFARPSSLGRRPIATAVQSAAHPENRRWRVGSLLCSTIHVVGSQDGRVGGTTARRLWDERLRANLEWLDAMTRIARDSRRRFDSRAANDTHGLHDSRHTVRSDDGPVRGLLIALHADMGRDDPQRRQDAWAPTLDAIAQLCNAFPGPVLLVHGDSHFFRSDRPMLRSRGIANLQRVICFGSPFSHSWVRIRWNPSGDPQFDDAERAAFFVATRRIGSDSGVWHSASSILTAPPIAPK